MIDDVAPASRTARTTVAWLAVVTVAGVALRTAVAARGWFYWDDLTLFAQAMGVGDGAADGAGADAGGPSGLAAQELFGLLATPHDGHLMPGAWLIEYVLAHSAGLSWPAAVGTLALLQLCAAVAVAWLCAELCPGRWAAVPLAAYLLTPLTLTSTTWLANAVNVLPLHAALAAALALSVRTLKRAGSHRIPDHRGHSRATLDVREHAGAGGRSAERTTAATRFRTTTQLGPALRSASGVAAIVLAGCLFSERAMAAAVVVPGFLVCYLASRRGRTPAQPSRRPTGPEAPRTAVLALSAGAGAASAIWAVVYALAVGDPRGWGTGPSASELTWHGWVHGLLPTLAGGPWAWPRWQPGPPFADAGVAGVIAGAVVLVAVLVWSGRRALAWVPGLVYPVLPLLALGVARGGPDTALEITLTLRHFSEAAVLLAAGLAVTLAGRGALRWRRAAGVLGVALAVSAGVSTLAYARSWAQQPTHDYVTTLRGELAGHDGPILDQDLPADVLLPVVHPYNRLSAIAPGLGGDEVVADWTREPTLVDADGRLVPAGLVTMRATVPGDDPGCGARVTGSEALELDGPLMDAEWVVEFNYFADRDGEFALRLDGQEVAVPARAGLNQVWVQLEGGGERLEVSARDGLELCVGRSPVGRLAVQ
ncbi:hypothetical protein [Corynebacterium frankenforstense]|uniref:hypothetical protein n=1 Tax=Corynebacterium frankenforstense TaxID=1230998 RepID=UPI000952C816|nr:hypothetical protein [Corynebacterium frankenforstense]